MLHTTQRLPAAPTTSRAQASALPQPQKCSRVVRAQAATPAAQGAVPASNEGAKQAASKPTAPVINVIPKNGREAGRAINGIPPVMGAHLMASGIAAPLSVSKGPGLDVTPHPFQYPSVEGDASIVLFFSKNGVAQGVVKAVLDAAEAAIAAKGSFNLVLSGGSLPGLLAGLADKKVADKAGFDKWQIYYVDERVVPHTSPDSTHKSVTEAFLSKVPIPASNVHAILENVPADQAATNYEGRLIAQPPTVLPRNAEGFPVFDLILLGVGPDGHIASLFPNKSQVAATKGWVLPVTNSPKPPPERITMTLPVINSAKDIVIVAAGEDKAEIVQRALEVQALPGALPAQLVRPTAGSLRWFLDVQSAQRLDITNWEDTKAFPRST